MCRKRYLRQKQRLLRTVVGIQSRKNRFSFKVYHLSFSSGYFFLLLTTSWTFFSAHCMHAHTCQLFKSWDVKGRQAVIVEWSSQALSPRFLWGAFLFTCLSAQIVTDRPNWVIEQDVKFWSPSQGCSLSLSLTCLQDPSIYKCHSSPSIFSSFSTSLCVHILSADVRGLFVRRQLVAMRQARTAAIMIQAGEWSRDWLGISCGLPCLILSLIQCLGALGFFGRFAQEYQVDLWDKKLFQVP